MRNHTITMMRSVAAAAAVAATGAVLVRAADNTQGQPFRQNTYSSPNFQPADGRIWVTREELPNGLEKFDGKEVRSADGQKLGTISDFVVNPQTGQISFAVVSSGGFAGIGDKLRLVPVRSIQQAGAEQFGTELQSSDWATLPIVNERDLRQGRIALSADQRQQLNPRWSQEFATLSQDPQSTRRSVILASELRDKSVHSGGREIAEVEDIAIDLRQGVATVLLETDSDFTGSDQYFVVPMNSLQLGMARNDPIITTLTQDDFRRAGSQVAARVETRDRDFSTYDRNVTTRQDATVAVGTSAPMYDRDYRRSEVTVPTQPGRNDSPTPTGMDSTQVDPVLQSAARAIRQVWDAHPELAKLDLRVTPQNGRLVFEGNVPNAQLWERAKDAAESVISRLKVDNRIMIQEQK